jgi:hypothetical protein
VAGPDHPCHRRWLRYRRDHAPIRQGDVDLAGARFMTEGVDGLLRDKTRKPGKAPLPAKTVQLVIDLVTDPLSQ